MSDSAQISFLMKMITDRVDTLITRELAIDSVTASQGRVLTYLVSRKGELTSQKDVEQYLRVSHTTAKGIIQRMEEKELVTTAFDDEDGRVKNIYLTEKSRATHRVIEQRLDAMEDILLNGIPKEARGPLASLLQRMYDNIK